MTVSISFYYGTATVLIVLVLARLFHLATTSLLDESSNWMKHQLQTISQQGRFPNAEMRSGSPAGPPQKGQSFRLSGFVMELRPSELKIAQSRHC